MGKEKDSVLIPIHKGGPQDGLGWKGMQTVTGEGVTITKRAKEERNIGQTCLRQPSHGGCEICFIPVPLGSLPSEPSLRVRLGSMPTDSFLSIYWKLYFDILPGSKPCSLVFGSENWDIIYSW